MTFAEHTAAAFALLFDALEKPRDTFRPVPALGTFVLRFDGIDRLTVDGETHFRIFVETRVSLAEAIFKLACPDETVTEEEVDRFCAEVLARLDEGKGKPWTCCSDAVVAWLKGARG